MKAPYIIDLIWLHSTGRDMDFRRTVEMMAEDEARKGNTALAAEIRRAAKGVRPRYKGRGEETSPRDVSSEP